MACNWSGAVMEHNEQFEQLYQQLQQLATQVNISVHVPKAAPMPTNHHIPNDVIVFDYIDLFVDNR